MSHRYLLFYKPFDVLCQFTNPDGLACATLKDFIDVPDVYSVGRLDRDSEGLLLLTDHGAMKHRLTHPQFQHPRTYWVQVERCPEQAALDQLRRGVTIKGGYRTRPAEVMALTGEPELPPRIPPVRFRKTVPTAWLSLTLTEGRNRQVRRMTAAVGYPTLRLVRVGMGAVQPGAVESEPPGTVLRDRKAGLCPAGLITLRGLKPGEWRDLSPQEIKQLPRLWEAAPSPAAAKSQNPKNQNLKKQDSNRKANRDRSAPGRSAPGRSAPTDKPGRRRIKPPSRRGQAQ